MSDVEESLNNFLISLGETHRLLAGKASELMRRAEWSEVSLTLDVGEMNADRSNRYLVVSGYVDGQLRGVGGVVWYFEASRMGTGWQLERRLRVIPDTDDDETDATELPVSEFRDSRALAEALPGLTSELLVLPAPRST